MRAARSEWRMSDAVAYDTMRARLNDTTARLLATARVDSDTGDATRVEVTGLRRDALAVDGFNRAAVDAFLGRLEEYWVDSPEDPA